jgi:hypothetical protein
MADEHKELWQDIQDDQIEQAVLDMLRHYGACMRPGLGWNMLLYWIKVPFPHPITPHKLGYSPSGYTAEERKTNSDWANRFHSTRVEPVVEKMLERQAIEADGRWIVAKRVSVSDVRKRP